MVAVTFAYLDGRRRTVMGALDDTLMRIALDHDVVGILADCGGSLSCGTCHIHVDEAWTNRLMPPTEAETAMLEMVIDPDERSRLACQIHLSSNLDGLIVHIPPAQI